MVLHYFYNRRIILRLPRHPFHRVHYTPSSKIIYIALYCSLFCYDFIAMGGGASAQEKGGVLSYEAHNTNSVTSHREAKTSTNDMISNAFCNEDRDGIIRSVRFIRLDKFINHGKYPKFPENASLCTNLQGVPRATSFMVYISHTWLRGWRGAEGYDKTHGAHPDTNHHYAFKLCCQGITKAWKTMAPGMRDCYVWLDYACAQLYGNDNDFFQPHYFARVMSIADCIFTPLYDAPVPTAAAPAADYLHMHACLESSLLLEAVYADDIRAAEIAVAKAADDAAEIERNKNKREKKYGKYIAPKKVKLPSEVGCTCFLSAKRFKQSLEYHTEIQRSKGGTIGALASIAENNHQKKLAARKVQQERKQLAATRASAAQDSAAAAEIAADDGSLTAAAAAAALPAISANPVADITPACVSVEDKYNLFGEVLLHPDRQNEHIGNSLLLPIPDSGSSSSSGKWEKQVHFNTDSQRAAAAAAALSGNSITAVASTAVSLSESLHRLEKSSNATRWNLGPHAYLNTRWNRLEMLAAATLPLIEDDNDSYVNMAMTNKHPAELFPQSVGEFEGLSSSGGTPSATSNQKFTADRNKMMSSKEKSNKASSSLSSPGAAKGRYGTHREDVPFGYSTSSKYHGMATDDTEGAEATNLGSVGEEEEKEISKEDIEAQLEHDRLQRYNRYLKFAGRFSILVQHGHRPHLLYTCNQASKAAAQQAANGAAAAWDKTISGGSLQILPSLALPAPLLPLSHPSIYKSALVTKAQTAHKLYVACKKKANMNFSRNARQAHREELARLEQHATDTFQDAAMEAALFYRLSPLAGHFGRQPRYTAASLSPAGDDVPPLQSVGLENATALDYNKGMSVGDVSNNHSSFSDKRNSTTHADGQLTTARREFTPRAGIIRDVCGVPSSSTLEIALNSLRPFIAAVSMRASEKIKQADTAAADLEKLLDAQAKEEKKVLAKLNTCTKKIGEIRSSIAGRAAREAAQEAAEAEEAMRKGKVYKPPPKKTFAWALSQETRLEKLVLEEQELTAQLHEVRTRLQSGQSVHFPDGSQYQGEVLGPTPHGVGVLTTGRSSQQKRENAFSENVLKARKIVEDEAKNAKVASKSFKNADKTEDGDDDDSDGDDDEDGDDLLSGFGRKKNQSKYQKKPVSITSNNTLEKNCSNTMERKKNSDKNKSALADDINSNALTAATGEDPTETGDYSKFVGSFLDGKKHGFGIQYLTNGDVYYGEHVHGQRHGHGLYRWGDGGHFSMGDSEHGHGSVIRIVQASGGGGGGGTSPNRTRTGSNTSKTGRPLVKDDGSVVSATEKQMSSMESLPGQNRRDQGLSATLWESHWSWNGTTGHQYEGEWRHGLKHGKGVLICNDFIYEGDFQNDSRHGYGKIVYNRLHHRSNANDAQISNWAQMKKNYSELAWEAEDFERSGIAIGVCSGVATRNRTHTNHFSAARKKDLSLYSGESNVNHADKKGTAGNSSKEQDQFFDTAVEIASSGGLPGFVAGDSYEGEWKEGERSGFGSLITCDGHVFRGVFTDDAYDHP